MRTLIAAAIIAAIGAQFAPGIPMAFEAACPLPVVWNPLWSENPHGIGGRAGDKRQMTREDTLAVLEAQLQDPYRHPMFDDELQREIARIKKTR